VKTEFTTLVISHHDPSFVINDAKDHTQFFQTTGSTDDHQLGTVTVSSTTRWDGPRLITEYSLSSRQKLVYTFTMLPATRQLVLRVRLDATEGRRTEGAELKLVNSRRQTKWPALILAVEGYPPAIWQCHQARMTPKRASLMFLSGAAGLIFEIVWLHRCGLVFVTACGRRDRPFGLHGRPALGKARSSVGAATAWGGTCACGARSRGRCRRDRAHLHAAGAPRLRGADHRCPPRATRIISLVRLARPSHC
jgi:hypothetical protein